MLHLRRMVSLVASCVAISACSKVGFVPQDKESKLVLPTPEIPVPVEPPPPVTPAPVEKAGFCQDGQNISACLACSAPAKPVPPPPPPPAISAKAQALVEILSLSCSISNRSDPPGYATYPTSEQLRNRLQACLESNYPDTPMSESQRNTIQSLRGSDPGMRQKFFGGLWYKPPYTDHFELYFGIESQEARRVFCYRNDNIEGDLLTSEYWQECRNSNDGCRSWKANAQAQARWKQAQAIRTGLKNCLDKQLPPQQPPVIPVEPPRLCEWKSMQGPVEVVRAYASTLAVKGYKMSFENDSSCRTDALPSDDGNIKVVGYRCSPAN